MPKVAVITDTDSSLPREIADRYGIRQVPITVQFGDQVLRSNVDIDDAGVFARIDQQNLLPTTAAPSPGDFAEAFQAAFDGGADSVLCYCVSSEVSATFGNAGLAARELMQARDITVVDSRSLSMGQGYMALAAAEALANGASREDAMAWAQSVGDRVRFYAALATLKYLAMSGRVGHLAAGMASLLNIKPILTIQDGKLDMLEKVRSRKRAWARVIELTGQAIGDRPPERLAIVHCDALVDAQAFAEQLRAQVSCPDDILYSELSAGLSVHSGRGLVGVGVVLGQ